MVFSFRDVFLQWENLGVFDFILPFILIFALVFGVLNYMKIFRDSRGLQAIIAVVLALLAAQWPFLGDFLREISPRLGVGIVILLVLLVLIGMFVPHQYQDIMGWILMGCGILIFIVITTQSFDNLGAWIGGRFGLSSGDGVGLIILFVLLIGLIVAVAASGKPSERNAAKKLASLFTDTD